MVIQNGNTTTTNECLSSNYAITLDNIQTRFTFYAEIKIPTLELNSLKICEKVMGGVLGPPFWYYTSEFYLFYNTRYH